VTGPKKGESQGEKIIATTSMGGARSRIKGPMGERWGGGARLKLQEGSGAGPISGVMSKNLKQSRPTWPRSDSIAGEDVKEQSTRTKCSSVDRGKDIFKGPQKNRKGKGGRRKALLNGGFRKRYSGGAGRKLTTVGRKALGPQAKKKTTWRGDLRVRE